VLSPLAGGRILTSRYLTPQFSASRCEWKKTSSRSPRIAPPLSKTSMVRPLLYPGTIIRVPNRYLRSAAAKTSPACITCPHAVTPSAYRPQHFSQGQYAVTRILTICHLSAGSTRPASSEVRVATLSAALATAPSAGSGLSAPAAITTPSRHTSETSIHAAPPAPAIGNTRPPVIFLFCNKPSFLHENSTDLLLIRFTPSLVLSRCRPVKFTQVSPPSLECCHYYTRNAKSIQRTCPDNRLASHFIPVKANYYRPNRKVFLTPCRPAQRYDSPFPTTCKFVVITAASPVISLQLDSSKTVTKP